MASIIGAGDRIVATYYVLVGDRELTTLINYANEIREKASFYDEVVMLVYDPDMLNALKTNLGAISPRDLTEEKERAEFVKALATGLQTSFVQNKGTGFMIKS